MRRATVTEAHAPVHEAVLMARAGARVRLVREDEEWPGWIWCENEAGVGGWAPAPFLVREGETAVFRRDYEATELTVQAGDHLLLHEQVCGWWWAADEQGKSGWIPASKVAL